MESIPIPWKKYGIHLEKMWNPSEKSMESIHHSMESIHQKYGIHPLFHGIHPPFHGIHLEFLQSTPHSMDSIWLNLGRVKYCQHGWTACTWYSLNSFLQSSTVKIFSAVLQLATENQQPLQFLKYNAHLDAYPTGLLTRKRPIGVIITPKKGLANIIVHFLPFCHVVHSPFSRFLNCQN